MNDAPIANNESTGSKVLHEPLLHFFLIAALIFGLYSFTQSSKENILEIEQSDIDVRIFQAELARGEELTEELRQLITSRYIEEQILVREAMAMELDNDARIHDILAQKMRHVLSGEIIQPSDEELNSFYQANLQRYRSEASITVDELVFDNRDGLSAEVISLLEQTGDPDTMLAIEEGSLSTLPGVNLTDLNNIFEESYANEVFNAEPGDWSGPFISNRGQHWLRVSTRTPSRLPPLSEITDLVRLDWISAEEEQRLQLEVDRLWEKYSIIINASSIE